MNPPALVTKELLRQSTCCLSVKPCRGDSLALLYPIDRRTAPMVSLPFISLVDWCTSTTTYQRCHRNPRTHRQGRRLHRIARRRRVQIILHNLPST